jgi:hypothetical protein
VSRHYWLLWGIYHGRLTPFQRQLDAQLILTSEDFMAYVLADGHFACTLDYTAAKRLLKAA